MVVPCPRKPMVVSPLRYDTDVPRNISAHILPSALRSIASKNGDADFEEIER